MNAATGRMKAKPSPISEKVVRMESMPVCGLAMRNEAIAPFDAFSFLRPIAVGTVSIILQNRFYCIFIISIYQHHLLSILSKAIDIVIVIFFQRF